MTIMRNIAWWLVFIIAAIIIEAGVPNLDALVVGIVILLQERDYKNMLWLVPIFVLVQEGLGTRQFGAIIFWYTLVCVLFWGARRIFESENFFFVFMLSASIGAAYYSVCWLMTPLQNIAFNPVQVADASLIQSIFIPFAWRLIAPTRAWTTRHG